MDDYLGELLDVAGEGTTVIVVSDHGFGPTGNLPWSGGHGRLTPGAPIAPPGILVLSGPGIAAGPRRLERAHVLDVAPTLLHLLGIPAGEDMIGQVEDADALMVYHETVISEATLARLEKCRVITRCGVGYDNVDLESARRRGIPVCNVPDYGTEDVADAA
ncbi:MAG: hypothetical protein GY704_00390, partial [Phycisphaeraceae bacterium]|nr:hypothetical protein [Phycisphaeraceae bacterium]